MTKSPDTGRLTGLDRFSDLSNAEVKLIASRGTQVHLPADWSLIWEKTPADKAYIILRGEVSVRRKGEEIARLGPGAAAPRRRRTPREWAGHRPAA